MAQRSGRGILLAAALLLGACTTHSGASEPLRVLFVGNSLVYTGNLPAVLDALSAANDRHVTSDMMVRGGATLAQWTEDGSVELLLQKKRYDYVLLQERGGDMTCHMSSTHCRQTHAALDALTALVRSHGATPVLLGTYQAHPMASRALVGNEAAAAGRLSIAHIPVSERFRSGQASAAGLEWLNADGAHPGSDLILLEAALIYRQLHGHLPAAAALTVTAPVYTPDTTFFPPMLASEKATVRGAADRHVYTAETVSTVLRIAGESTSSAGSPETQ